MNGYESRFAGGGGGESQDDQIQKLKEANDNFKTKIAQLSEELKEACLKADQSQQERQKRVHEHEKQINKRTENLKKQTRQIFSLKKEIESLNIKIQTTGGLQKAITLQDKIKIAKKEHNQLQKEMKLLDGIQKKQYSVIEKYNKDTQLPDKVQSLKEQLEKQKKKLKELQTKHKQESKQFKATFDSMRKAQQRYRELKQYEKSQSISTNSSTNHNTFASASSAGGKLRSNQQSTASAASAGVTRVIINCLSKIQGAQKHSREYQLITTNMRTEQRNFYSWKKAQEEKKKKLQEEKTKLQERVAKQENENQQNAHQMAQLKKKVKDKKGYFEKHIELQKQKEKDEYNDKVKELQRLKQDRQKQFHKKGLLRKSTITTYTDKKKQQVINSKTKNTYNSSSNLNDASGSKQNGQNLVQVDDDQDILNTDRDKLPKLTAQNLDMHNSMIEKTGTKFNQS